MKRKNSFALRLPVIFDYCQEVLQFFEKAITFVLLSKCQHQPLYRLAIF